jgi:hypothetical protein
MSCYWRSYCFVKAIFYYLLIYGARNKGCHFWTALYLHVTSVHMKTLWNCRGTICILWRYPLHKEHRVQRTVDQVS